jgi:hypothetical protein
MASHRRSGERYKTEMKSPHSLASQQVAVVAVVLAEKSRRYSDEPMLVILEQAKGHTIKASY